jgi:uncharacterized protein
MLSAGLCEKYPVSNKRGDTAMTDQPQHTLCWAEIPVTDLDKARKFYEAALGVQLTLQDGGPNMMAVIPSPGGDGFSAHLYPGQPAARGTGSSIHLTAHDPLETVMERVTKAGGEVVSPPIDIPSGRFFYALDLDGNSIGFFNLKAA